MILWKKYNGITPELIEKVGWLEEDLPKGGSKYSNIFIVLVRFSNSPRDDWEPRLANIIQWDRTGVVKHSEIQHISIHGMQGNVDISHYSQINIPKK